MTEKTREASIEKTKASFSSKGKKEYKNNQPKLTILRRKEAEQREKEKLELQNIETSLDQKTGRLKIDISKIKKPEEIQERLNNLQIKSKQLTVLKGVGEAYQSYLESILSQIRFRKVSDKPERYEKQIIEIDRNIKKIKKILEDRTLKLLQETDVEGIIGKIFKSEEEISQTGRWDHFFTSPEEVNKRYEEIKKLINDLEKEDDVLEIKLKIYELLRENEGLDDDKHKYNSGEGIQRDLADDILSHPELRKQTMTNIYFQALENLKIDPEEKKKLVKGAEQQEILYQKIR